MDADDLPELDHAELGAFRTEHRTGSGWHVSLIVTSVLLALVGNGFGAVIGFAVAWSAPAAWGVALVGGAVSLLFAATPTAALVTAVRWLRQRVLVFKDGFVLVTGTRAETVLWRDVAAVYERARPVLGHGPAEGVTVRTRAGRVVALPALFRDRAGLTGTVRRGVAAALLPDAVAALDAGRGVAFDVPWAGWLGRTAGLTLSAAGLDDGRKLVPWADVASVLVEPRAGGAHLTVRTRGRTSPWYARPLGTVPNVELLLKLARRFLPPDCHTGRTPPYC